MTEHVRIARLKKQLASPNLTPAQRRILTGLLDRLEAAQSTPAPPTPVPTRPKVTRPTPAPAATPTSSIEDTINLTIPVPAAPVTYTEEQQQAIDLALEGKSLILTGAAGTGKTTVLHGIATALIQQGTLGIIQKSGHKHLHGGTPGIVLVSYTNKAVENAKKRMPDDIRPNCITAHKLLEFQPEYYERYDPETGTTRESMRFVPTRDETNPNTSTIRTLIIEETTLVDVPLWNMLIESLPPTAPDLQVIFVGDIQQLPPVFGKSIFIHAMQRGMPTIELTQVHRQAAKSPILSLAHRVLSGKPIPAPELEDYSIENADGKVTIRSWKQKRSLDFMLVAVGKLFPSLIDGGQYDPEQDVILCPWGKSLGVDLINEIVASHHALAIGAEVHEVFAGHEKLYLRIGERVLYNKTGHRVIGIVPNPSYFGPIPRPASTTMDYHGVESDLDKLARFNAALLGGDHSDMVDALLNSMSSHVDEDNPRRRQASHIIVVESEDTGEEHKLHTAGELNDMLLGYALTVHRSQGSEYNRVILFLHSCHASMTFRELLYTAITRAKKELVVLCENNTFVRGITSQRLPGRNVAEKIAAFETYLVQQARSGTNEDQVPKGLYRFTRDTTPDNVTQE